MAPKYVYHYTTKEGLKGILEDMKIYQSVRQDNDDDAAFGSGVYFTALGPETSTEKLLSNNYRRDGPEMEDKVDCYIRIEVAQPNCKIKNMTNGNRDVWKCRGDLDLTKVKFTHGNR